MIERSGQNATRTQQKRASQCYCDQTMSFKDDTSLPSFSLSLLSSGAVVHVFNLHFAPGGIRQESNTLDGVPGKIGSKRHVVHDRNGLSEVQRQREEIGGRRPSSQRKGITRGRPSCFVQTPMIIWFLDPSKIQDRMDPRTFWIISPSHNLYYVPIRHKGKPHKTRIQDWITMTIQRQSSLRLFIIPECTCFKYMSYRLLSTFLQGAYIRLNLRGHILSNETF